jgi:hypothetical protein
VGLDGLQDGFPVVIDGDVSGPSFDAAGRIHVTAVPQARGPAQTFVLDGDGQPVPTGSSQLEITATSDWWGAGDSHPAAPLVGADGTTFVIDTTGDTTVAGLSPSGQLMDGWPYRSSLTLQDTGFCPAGDTGCGGLLAAPAIGPDNVLYLLRAAATSAAGGSIVAIGPDGRVVSSWPVGLRRPGSEFWSIVVAADSQAYALAIEPEPNGSHSATILSISPDSAVRYRATIVEP